MRKSWHYFNTPLSVYLTVMGAISALMAWALAADFRGWVRGSAALVIGVSFYGLLRGYGRRLVVDERGVEFRGLVSRHRLAWGDVRRVEQYAPSGALNGVKYVYVTTRDEPPVGPRDVDRFTFQVQDRPGLLADLQTARECAAAMDAKNPPNTAPARE